MERDFYIWKCVTEWLRDEGLCSRAAAYILYAMAAEGLNYQTALRAYAEFINDAPERVHAQICYAILCTNYDVGPETFLQTFLDERCFD